MSVVKDPEPDVKPADWVSRDNKAKLVITTALDMKILQTVINCSTAREIWTRLSTVHEQKSEANRYFVQSKFFEYKMAPEDNMAAHISKVESLARQLENFGEKVSDEAIITKMLCTLPSEYNHLISSWDSTSDDKKTIDNLVARLLKAETMQISQQESSSGSSAFLLKKQGNKGNKKTTTKDKTNKTSKETIEEKKKRTKCSFCKNIGHWYKECRERIKDEENAKNEEPSSTGTAFTVISQASVAAQDSEMWLADSGATDHMSGNREWLTNFKELNVPVRIRLANNKTTYATGCGDITISAMVVIRNAI